MNKTIFQVLPAFRMGGAEIMAENLILELHNRGYKVITISLYKEHTSITKRLEKKGINIIYLNKRKGIDFKVVLLLRKLIKKYKPSVIHTHLYVLEYVLMSSIFIKTKVVHTVHNIATKEVKKSRRLIRKLIFKYKKVKPVSISPLVRQSIYEEYHLKNKFIPLIYNGINLNQCIQKKNYCMNSTIKIITIGRLEEQKNHENLIKAVNKLKDKNIHLEIIGTGTLRKKLEKLIIDLHCSNHIKLLGERNEVYKYLNNSDIFILPSKWEGMPITLIEAMGTGMPIIASGVGGILDMIENEVSGIICSPDIKSIQYSIEKMINLKNSQRQEMGQLAFQKSKIFSSTNMCTEYIKLY